MPTTRVGTVNQTVTTGGGTVVIFKLKEHLKANGWTILGSGDGLSAYSAPGDVITHAGSGANGMANTRAWVVLGDPGNSRSFTFQRGLTDQSWRVITTESTTLAAGDAITTLDAISTTKGNIGGSLSATSPTYDTGFFPSATSWRVHIVSDTVPVPGSNVYPFYYIISTAGTTAMLQTLMIDGLVAGTYDPAVPPWVCVNVTGNIGTFGTSGQSNWHSWRTPTAWVTSMQKSSSGGTTTVGFTATTLATSFGVDPIEGLDWMVPVISVFGSELGVKGVQHGLKHGLTIRLTGNTLNLSTDPYIYWCAAVGQTCLCLPWIDGVAPSL